MTGDADKQPVESVDSLTALGGMIEDGEEALEESEEGDESEDSEEEEDTEDGEDSPEPEAKTLTLKHEGKEVKLTETEAIELAQKGFDYSQKTMALSEERKAVAAEREKAEASYRQYDESLSESMRRMEAFAQFVEHEVGRSPDIALAYENPAQFIAEKEIYEQRKGQLNNAYQALRNMSEERDRMRQSYLAQKANETEAALKSTLPGYGENTISELADYIGGFGLTPEASGDVFVEKGLWELAHKAKAYDALLAKKATLKPVEKLPKVSKPTASNPPSKEAANKASLLENHKKRGDLASLGALI